MERYRIVFSGSGGQGVITASIILAEAAAIHEGLNAVQSQSYGPEARGGATKSDVIISDREIRFPKVNQPNVLVCLTQKAYNKFSGLIKPGGLLISDREFVRTARRVDARLIELPLYEMVVSEICNPVVLNICVLGALIGMRHREKEFGKTGASRQISEPVDEEKPDGERYRLRNGIRI